MKHKKSGPKPSVVIEAPSYIKRNWGWLAGLFVVYSVWAFAKYNGEFFPISFDRFMEAVSWDGLGAPSPAALLLYLYAFLIYGMLLAEAAWLGWLALRLWLPREPSPFARALLCVAMGLAMLSLIAMGLAFGRVNYPVVYRGLFAIGALAVIGFSVAHAGWRLFWSEAWADGRAAWREAGLGIFKYAVAAFLAFNLWVDLTPEVFYDCLFYHLALPHLYLLEHRMVTLPYMNFSKFPQGMEILFSWGLALQGDIVTKWLHGGMGILAFFALISICRRMGAPRAWPIAGAILLTIPVVSITSWNSGVDMTLVFYSLMAFYAVLAWSEAEESTLGWAITAGCFAGMAASTKYMGGSVVMALIPAMLWVRWRSKQVSARVWKDVVLFGAIAVAWVSPWFLRNLIDTGNPVYPLFYKVLGGANLSAARMANFMEAVRGYRPHTLWEWFRTPWALTVGEPKPGENTCWLGPSFWVVLPAIFFIPRKQRGLSLLVIYTALTFLIEWPSTNQARYLLQGYAALALLVAIGVMALYDSGWRAIRGLVLLPFLAAIVSNAYASALIAHLSYSPGPVTTGQITRVQYTSVYHQGMNPNPMIPLYEWMKTAPHAPGRVLFVAEEKTFGCPWPYVYGNVYDYTPIVEWTRHSASPEELNRLLKNEGIRYIAYNVMEGNRLTHSGYGIFYWTEDEKKRFGAFWQRFVRARYAQNGLCLFEILPAEEAAKEAAIACPFLEPAKP